MKGFYEKIIEEGIIKPQIKRQVGWVDLDNLPPKRSPWNKGLADMNESTNDGMEGTEGEHLDQLSGLFKKPIKVF